ncbi:c-type cytochrome [Burkholderia gladioli]|uniref:c-type cytochrome n=1 Tax=Burkholderia gladioli TaxID=28095 RepID=UPI001ABB39C6|nr:c-type cytochrome [Burkholderia gladioli]
MIRIRRSAASGISCASSRRLAPALLALACLGAAGGAHAVGNPAQGQARFGACVACHGANGSLPTSPAFPKIGGQNAAYLAYKSGQRNGGTAQMMQPMAQGLSDRDIDDLAAYIATLGPK